MRVSYNWLREFVPVDAPPEEIAERLTFAGVAVENVERLGQNVCGVYTGRILEVTAHPNADRLVVCKVDCGPREGSPYQIVTGAKNVRAGQVVPVALEGARLAGGMVIKKARFRGLESRGMLCAADELGIGADHEGILILPEDTPVGVDVKTILGLDDAILLLDLTPNRGDCLSVYGTAREVAAIYGLPLSRPQRVVDTAGRETGEQVRIEIEDPSLCLRYVARLITGIKIGPSPLWMQTRLTNAGMRPINNVVDVTNYVMLETGQPMHAFDFQTVKKGHIIVRPARSGERLTTLDGVDRRLDPEMLLIAGEDGPLGLAGVMGGQNSEVTTDTTDVLLESAYFDPRSIRRTARRLGLRSEASSRFEKGVDFSGCAAAAERAVQLLAMMNAGTVAPGEVDLYPAPLAPKTLILRPARVGKILGVDVPEAQIKQIMERLEFQPQELGEQNEFLVTVPAHRPDVDSEIDLVEEVARLYGYDKIPTTLPSGKTMLAGRSEEQAVTGRLKTLLTGLGFTETVTFTFVHPGVADRIGLSPDSPLRGAAVTITNPINEDQSVMRTLLFPSLVEALARNCQRRNTDVALFEISKVFLGHPDCELPEERSTLALAVCGKTAGGWNVRPREMDFYFVKGAIEQVLAYLGVDRPEFVVEDKHPSFHPGRAAKVMVNDRQVAVFGELHPDVQDAYDLTLPVVTAEIDLKALPAMQSREWGVQPLPRFPSVERDLAVVLPDTVSAAEVTQAIIASGGEYLSKVSLFDVYTGRQIPAGYRSLAFALKFVSLERTLTDDEVNQALAGIRSSLHNRLNAEMRA